jgi:cell division protein FtsI/penicillin-binding protein 2
MNMPKRQKPEREIERRDPVHSWRRVRFLLFFVAAFGGLALFRLSTLQILGVGKWKALAENQHSVSQMIIPDRGGIFFRDGTGTYPVAVNQAFPLLSASPKEIEDPARTARSLADILGLDAEDIRAKLTKPDDAFEIIKKKLSDDEVSRVKALDLKGLSFTSEKYRYYPGRDLASQVIGFVSPDDKGVGIGRYGFESAWNDELQGKVGQVKQERDAGGRWISLTDRQTVSAKEGEDMVLTIDRVIQHEVEKILTASVEKHQADRGTAIVIEPTTGKILAMASTPSFDPNEYASVDDYSKFMNPAVSSSYEPGSVMKPITIAMGIEEGKITPDTEYVDTGAVTESGYTIHNSENKVYGRSSMTKVLEESINTGVIFVEKQVGNRRFADYLDRFGFGKKTGVILPAELSGNTKTLGNFNRNLEFYTAAFGQGITSTPLQMVMAYEALANGGVLMKPQLIERIFHRDGREEDVAPTEVRRVVSEDTAKQVGGMLRDVVTNGHGKRADVPGYLVVGKTGTAQVAKAGEKGYQDGLSIGTFVGYAPQNDPKFVLLVKIDNPKDVQWAESSAAPVFGEVMKFLLDYAKIEPTEVIGNQKSK